MISTHFVSIHSKVGCCRVPGIINFAPLYPRHWPFNHFVHIWHFVVGSGWQFSIGCNCFHTSYLYLPYQYCYEKRFAKNSNCKLQMIISSSCMIGEEPFLKLFIFWHFTNLSSFWTNVLGVLTPPAISYFPSEKTFC